MSIWKHIVFFAAATLTFSYYNWLARSTGNHYEWRSDLQGYYNYLGRAFAQGRLDLPIAPPKELLALPDPWDPAANGPWRLHDGVLYKGRYYLYHGAGPALVLFAPWRIVTGHDLPESFALVLLCFSAYLFLSATLMAVLNQAGASPGLALLALMLLVLAAGTGVPYLLIRIWVYELAIAGAYFGVAGGLFCFVRGLTARRPVLWFVLAGAFLGIAMASRPHVGLAAGASALGVLIWRRRRRPAFAIGITLVLSGAAVLAYNYARFDNALEFGTHYQLTGERNQQRLNPAVANLYPGAYYMLFCPPSISAVFPFVNLVGRMPAVTETLPPDYFFEPTVGALLISPMLAGVLLLAFLRRGPPVAITAAIVALGTAAGAFLFVITIGLTAQRYQIDFVPVSAFAAVVCAGVAIAKWNGWRRATVLTAFTAASAWTIFANAGLGMSGPYDEILQHRPNTWIRIAGWFSAAAEHKPMLNPRVAIAMRITPKKYGPGLREPLIVLGREAHRWTLYIDHTDAGIRLGSASNTTTETAAEILQPLIETTIRAEYEPASRLMTISIDGDPQIRHHLEALVFASSQVEIGRNDIVQFFSYPEFTGTMQVIERRIEPVAPAG